MIVVILGLVSFGIALIYGWVKFFNWIWPKQKKQTATPTPPSNPYIDAHKRRQQNDKYYEDYLNWMDKTGADLPMDKVKSKEEIEFEKKYKQAQR
ncbi:hypothetical protein [Mesonia aestuariivivens]|uniref:DUF4834 family protein n=1 Tax=Mesonia aestuariivivens TaxID=2796128 RepID=A0ABS6W178_9FLAO|nr:hypothetical protein [Mesonia aestuariivivens]MBW2961271.1 hypothetical protein [Mesonia aestuariivivens]